MVRNPEKKKLTLSIDSEVIEKAKELGLNLSEITEQALKISSLSDDDKIVTPNKLHDAYIDILKTILKIMKKWGLKQLQIGGYFEHDGLVEYWYKLVPDGVYLGSNIPSDEPWEPEEPMKRWRLDDENLPFYDFYNFEKIIANLINKLYEKAIKNKAVLDKLQIMKNILELSGLSK